MTTKQNGCRPTKPPPPPPPTTTTTTPQEASRVHESNPPALAAKLEAQPHLKQSSAGNNIGQN